MEQVKKLVEKAQQTGQHGKRHTTRNALSEDWVSAIFAKFRGRYGPQWTSRYASDKEYQIAKREWGEVLATMTGEQIRRGLEYWDDNHPPNAYEFRQACQEPKGYAAHKPFRGLPKPKGDPEKAKVGMEALRQALGK